VLERKLTAALMMLGTGLACSDGEPPDQIVETIVTESAACKVVYTVSSQWSGGFTASVNVTNHGVPVQSWSLDWNFPSGQRVTSGWDATITQSNASVTARSMSYNGALGTGAIGSFGFNGSFASSNSSPTSFTFNGQSCGSAGSGGSGGTTSSGGSTSSGGATSSGGTAGSGGTASGTCNYPTWQQGVSYRTGNVVRYPGDNRYYIAEHDNPGYDPTISTWYWDPYVGCSSSGSGGTAGSGASGGSTGGGGSGGSGFAAVISESMFNSMFPSRNSFYTYQGLIVAAAAYPAFANTGDLTTRRREAAAFLANVFHETGGLYYIEEVYKGDYCASSAACPCEPGKRYFGRGPIQLSWNYNYCSAGQALGLNLRADPDLVARDASVAWKTSLWFWMTQTGAGRMTAHDAMVGGYGFGETIRTINGALECNGGNPSQVQSRVSRYQSFTQMLGVTPGNNLSC
jgi:predicted chitinase